jgi:hypothetical protein
MGTNYYLHTRMGDRIHLGKKSIGWKFVFHCPFPNIKTGEAFGNWLMDQVYGRRAVIKNEYNEAISYEDFMRIATTVKGKCHYSYLKGMECRGEDLCERKYYLDDLGYTFCDYEFS